MSGRGAWAVYAWVLMPNNYHLLIETKNHPLADNMRKLLTGYAVNFNRRHNRNCLAYVMEGIAQFCGTSFTPFSNKFPPAAWSPPWPPEKPSRPSGDSAGKPVADLPGAKRKRLKGLANLGLCVLCAGRKGLCFRPAADGRRHPPTGSNH